MFSPAPALPLPMVLPFTSTFSNTCLVLARPSHKSWHTLVVSHLADICTFGAVVLIDHPAPLSHTPHEATSALAACLTCVDLGTSDVTLLEVTEGVAELKDAVRGHACACVDLCVEIFTTLACTRQALSVKVLPALPHEHRILRFIHGARCAMEGYSYQDRFLGRDIEWLEVEPPVSVLLPPTGEYHVDGLEASPLPAQEGRECRGRGSTWRRSDSHDSPGGNDLQEACGTYACQVFVRPKDQFAEAIESADSVDDEMGWHAHGDSMHEREHATLETSSCNSSHRKDRRWMGEMGEGETFTEGSPGVLGYVQDGEGSVKQGDGGKQPNPGQLERPKSQEHAGEQRRDFGEGEGVIVEVQDTDPVEGVSQSMTRVDPRISAGFFDRYQARRYLYPRVGNPRHSCYSSHRVRPFGHTGLLGFLGQDLDLGVILTLPRVVTHFVLRGTHFVRYITRLYRSKGSLVARSTKILNHRILKMEIVAHKVGYPMASYLHAWQTCVTTIQLAGPRRGALSSVMRRRSRKIMMRRDAQEWSLTVGLNTITPLARGPNIHPQRVGISTDFHSHSMFFIAPPPSHKAYITHVLKTLHIRFYPRSPPFLQTPTLIYPAARTVTLAHPITMDNVSNIPTISNAPVPNIPPVPIHNALVPFSTIPLFQLLPIPNHPIDAVHPNILERIFLRLGDIVVGTGILVHPGPWIQVSHVLCLWRTVALACHELWTIMPLVSGDWIQAVPLGPMDLEITSFGDAWRSRFLSLLGLGMPVSKIHASLCEIGEADLHVEMTELQLISTRPWTRGTDLTTALVQLQDPQTLVLVHAIPHVKPCAVPPSGDLLSSLPSLVEFELIEEAAAGRHFLLMLVIPTSCRQTVTLRVQLSTIVAAEHVQTLLFPPQLPVLSVAITHNTNRTAVYVPARLASHVRIDLDTHEHDPIWPPHEIILSGLHATAEGWNLKASLPYDACFLQLPTNIFQVDTLIIQATVKCATDGDETAQAGNGWDYPKTWGSRVWHWSQTTHLGDGVSGHTLPRLSTSDTKRAQSEWRQTGMAWFEQAPTTGEFEGQVPFEFFAPRLLSGAGWLGVLEDRMVVTTSPLYN
ncbi:hypothetical protein OF83DRAFT_1087535 [Amylostereum chailletii]|nr:hypothetical protein OF83DRAFT_1087535 [Amylostereum chailletii]